MSAPKAKKLSKPTVFLSHSSTNRRELAALKRLLDERSGGLIEFFLSSDDDSIAHGTIWPAEVRAALDRMALMLIFVSTEALKSGWTYFEAGYGLHKLGSAKIYCLPGTDKAALPSPFNILQNRNLHSARDLSLLIKQINEALEAKVNEVVETADYNQIFKKINVGQVSISPSLERVLESVTVKTAGPANSIDLFSEACTNRGLPISLQGESLSYLEETEVRYSTGVRLSVTHDRLDCDMDAEFEITDKMRSEGYCRIHDYGGWWSPDDSSGFFPSRLKTVTLAEIEDHNGKIRQKNAETEAKNAARLTKPRVCEFILSPINFSVPVSIVDDWWSSAGHPLLIASISLLDEIQIETRVEAITAKIHNSPLSPRGDGSLLWADKIVVKLGSEGHLRITASCLDGKSGPLSSIRIEDLMNALFELGILTTSTSRSRKRR